MDKKRFPLTDIVAQDFMKDSWLFCIDEFQATDIATASVLKEILKSMYKQGAVLVTTSNRLPTGHLILSNFKWIFHTLRNLQGRVPKALVRSTN